MIKNYLKIILRGFYRQRVYSIINITGLSIGLATAILVLLYVKDEMSYDRHIPDAENIYRVGGSLYWSGKWVDNAASVPSIGPAAVNSIPEVEKQVRFCQWGKVTMRYQDKKFSQSLYFTEGAVGEIFDLKILKGDINDLDKDKTLALSEKVAERYFGKENPLGKSVDFNGKFNMTVVAVFEDMTQNTHLPMRVLGSLQSICRDNMWGSGALDSWVSVNFYTYIKVNEEHKPTEVQNKLAELLDKNLPDARKDKYKIMLEPLPSIYLDSDVAYKIGRSGNRAYVNIFTAIFIGILLLACINYMNLSTARSMKRAKEVGIRKVSGGRRSDLIIQFLGESFAYVILSFLFALLIVELVLPLFNQISHKSFELSQLIQTDFILLLGGILLVVGLVSGSYPAFYLSSFRPAAIFKSDKGGNRGSAAIRKVLVIAQFAVSVALIVGAIVVYTQLNYMQNKELGYDSENVLFIDLNTPGAKENIETYKQEILKNPNIINAYASQRIMGYVSGGWHVKIPEAKDPYEMTVLFVDQDFVKTLNLDVIQGRDFSNDMGTDREMAFLMNKAAAEKFNWKNDAVGKSIEVLDIKEGKVIGVLNDFHFESLHHEREPLIITMAGKDYHRIFNYLGVRINGENLDETIAYLESTWKTFEPAQDFSFEFLDDYLKYHYQSERRLGKIIFIFTLIAILIGCLGLFGLALFTMEQRTKEIGIRKVFGARMVQIGKLVVRDFSVWILIANIIGWPVAYYFLGNWLDNFPYRIELGIWIFILAGLVSYLIAMISVAYVISKLSTTNPVESLRYE